MALVAHYPLNGDTKDYSGYGRHGTATSVEWVDGKTGLSAKLAGASNRISIPTPPIDAYFSVALWHYSDPEVGSPTWRTLIGTASNIHPLMFSGRFSLGVFDGGFKSFNYTIPINVWIHISVVYDILGNSANLYINGVFESSINITYNSANNPINAIGGGVGYSYSSGYIEDVRIYDHVLSDKEVKELAKAKVLHYKFDEQDLTTNIVKDFSGFGNDGTVAVATAPSWSEDSPVGRGSMEFSVSKFIDAKHKIPLRDDSTVSFWVNTSTTSTATLGCSRTVLGKGFSIFLLNAGTIRWDTGDQQWSTGHALKRNQWVHYTLVRRGNTKELYENAVLVKSTSYTGSMTNLGSSYSIGMSQVSGGSYGNYLNGTVSDYRIYATALTPEDVLELYQTRASVDNEGNLFVHEINEMSPTLKSIDSRGIASYIEFNEMGEDNKMSIGDDGVVYVNEIMET